MEKATVLKYLEKCQNDIQDYKKEAMAYKEALQIANANDLLNAIDLVLDYLRVGLYV